MNAIQVYSEPKMPHILRIIRFTSWVVWISSMMMIAVYFPPHIGANYVPLFLVGLLGFFACVAVYAFVRPKEPCKSCTSTNLKSWKYCERCLDRKTKSLKSFSGNLCCTECNLVFKNYDDVNDHFLARHDARQFGGEMPHYYKLSTHLEDLTDIYYVYNQDMTLYQKNH